MQRNQISMGAQSDPNVLHKFKAGFADCTDEVNRYINQIDGVEAGVKQRLIGHLNTCVGGLQQVSPPPPPSQYQNYGNNYCNNVPFGSNTMAVHQQSTVVPLPQDVNNNGRIQMGGVQLIPSRLPSGELALVMPNSSNLPYFPNGAFPSGQSSMDLNASRPRVSAFNSVSKSVKQMSTDTSPPLSPASSLSSSGDETSMSPPDYQPMTTTPPLQTQQNLSAFPTPPSGGSLTINIAGQDMTGALKSRSAITLQQQQVTSTTEPPQSVSPTGGLRLKPLSVITNITSNTPLTARSDVQYVNKKRPYPIDMTCDDEIMQHMMKCEPAEKQFKLDTTVAQNQHDHDNEQANGDMWRPW